MPKGIPLTEEGQHKRRSEILEIAVKLFVINGFNGTSMREIAEAAGMGKSSLYDYFNTKDEILAFLIEEESREALEHMEAIIHSNLPPDECIRQMMRARLTMMEKNSNLLLRLIAEAQNLKGECLKRVQQSRYAQQDVLRSVFEEGISKGYFRNIDALLAARLLSNSIASIMFATRPTGSIENMMDQAVDIFLNGIKS